MTDITTEKIIFSVKQQNVLFTPTVKTIVFSAIGSSNNVSFVSASRKIIFAVRGGSGNVTNINSDWDSTEGYSEIFNKPSTFPPKQHNHALSDIHDLEETLGRKVDDAQVLTSVPVGAVFTDTVYNDFFIQGEVDLNTDHSRSQHAPVSAQENVQSDWNAIIGDELILNKPPFQLPVNLTVSPIAPTSPGVGDLWIDLSGDVPDGASVAVLDGEQTMFDGDPIVTFEDKPQNPALFGDDDTEFDGDPDVGFRDI